MKNSRFRSFISVFFVSLALLAFEVGLTRYLSAVLHYHYAFLVSSGAVLGLGLGSYLALGKPNLGPRRILPVLLCSVCLATGLFFAGPYLPGIIPYFLLGSLPSLCAGIWYGKVYRDNPENSGLLYCADLIGAGLAALTVLAFLDRFGLIALFALAILSVALAWTVYEKGSWKSILASVLAVGLGATALTGGLRPVELKTPAFTGGPASPINRSGGEIIYSYWDSFARTDVIQTENPQSRYISIDGGAFSAMWKFDGNLEDAVQGKNNIGYLPFALGARDDVLIIGSGGGKDIVQALLGGHRKIFAVEINRGSVEATRLFSDFSGSVYDLDNVKPIVGDGRNYVRSSQQKFDIVYLAQVMAQAADLAGYALAENYIYTKEAYNDYFESLKEGGYLAFVAHDESDMSRIISTGIESLQERGVEIAEIDQHFAVAYTSMAGHQGMPHSPVIIISPQPLKPQMASIFALEARNYGHTVYHLPGVTEDSVISLLADGHFSYDDWLREAPWNIRPVGDNNPFFYNFERGIPHVLTLLTLIGLVVAVWFILRAEAAHRLKINWFAVLGLGFMLVETPLIQQFVLFLGHPARGFTIVLAALLICAGIGSIAGSWVQRRYGERNVKRLLLALPAVLIAQIFLFPLLFTELAGLSSAAKAVITWLLVAPAGILLGIPFPQALSRLGEKGLSRLVPLAWAVNGAMSLVGAVLAIIIAMYWGFAASMLIGAIVYLGLIIKQD